MNLSPDADREELWAEPERRRGLLPAAAAKWAAAGGPDLFRTVQMGLFEANHAAGKKIGRPGVLEEVLTGLGLDGPAVTKDILEEPRWLAEVRADCDEAEQAGVFGVPTLVFPGCRPIFVRLLATTEGDRAAEVLRRVREAAEDPVIHELKHPPLPRQ